MDGGDQFFIILIFNFFFCFLIYFLFNKGKTVFFMSSAHMKGIIVIYTPDMSESVLLTDSVTEGLKVTKKKPWIKRGIR